MKAFLNKLRELQLVLNQPDQKMKLLEAHSYFQKTGSDCKYATKCENLIMKDMYPEVRRLLAELHEMVNKIE